MAKGEDKSDKVHLWTTNDLILDALFALLPTKDLLNVRRTCKQWAKVGGRELGKRTVICFTDSKFAGTADFVTRFFDFNASTREYLWECHCFLDKYVRKRFISIDTVNYQAMFAWDSEFQPRTCSILGFDTLAKLSQAQTSKVTSLQVIKIPFFQVSSVLSKAHILFENLKHLEVREIDVKARRTYGEVYDDLQRNGTADTSEVVENSSNLESLIIEISPYWTETSWKCLSPYVKLQRLEINWYKGYHRGYSGMTNKLQDKTNYYGACLQNMISSNVCSSLVTVKQLSLRFELTTANRMSAQKFLIEFHNLTRLSLQVRGHFAELEYLLVGLQRTASEALQSLHIVNQLRLWDENQVSEFSQLFTTLGHMEYFRKPKWTLVCRNLRRGWVRLIKTNTMLIFQLQGCGVERKHIFQVIEAVLGRQSYLPQNYNYAYHKIMDNPRNGFMNDYENLNEGTLFKAYFLKAEWKAMHKSVCRACRDGPRLLADLPGFRRDVGFNFIFPDDHYAEGWSRTWTFMLVPRDILAKWRVQLVSEIAAAKGNQKCTCRWWDFVTRMKQGQYKQSSFTDKEDRRFPDTLNNGQMASLACMFR